MKVVVLKILEILSRKGVHSPTTTSGTFVLLLMRLKLKSLLSLPRELVAVSGGSFSTDESQSIQCRE